MENNTLVLNLDNVDASALEFTALPKGEYECIVEDVEFKFSKNGAPMLTWKFKVVDGEFAKRILFNHTVLNNDFGIAMLKKTIVSSGCEVDMASFNPQEFSDNGDAIGLPILLKVGIQTYDGKKTNNVKDVLPSASVGSFWS